MEKLITFANKKLKNEIKIVKRDFNSVFPTLSVEEKAVIYWYSESGYEIVNSLLRTSKGKDISPLGELLSIALSKLQPYEGVVYRGINFSGLLLEHYKSALRDRTLITEFGFTSSSVSSKVALMYGKDILLEIFGKTGKKIDSFSKYGLNSGQNEREVLFDKGLKFIVMDISPSSNRINIIIKEV